MPRPRRPSKTAYGAWLSEWLERQDFTVVAFAERVGVTKSAVSLWLSGDTKSVPERRLRRVAEVTGEPYENLERMVYGGDEWTPPKTGLTPDEMGDLIEERVKRAVAEALARYFPAGPPDERGS